MAIRALDGANKPFYAKYLCGGKEWEIIRGGHDDGCRSHSPSVQLAAKRLYHDPNQVSTIIPYHHKSTRIPVA